MKKTSENRSLDLGFTLVEMMLGVSLAGFVIFGLAVFFKNTAESQARKAARSAAMKTNKTFIELVKRDFRFQTAFAIGPAGKSLDLTRRRLYQKSVANGIYKILFHTECVKINLASAPKKALLEKAYNGQNSDVFDKAPGQCIRSLKCTIDELPQVQLTVNATGADVPVYAPLAFPNISVDLKEQSVGTVLCFQAVQTKVRMVVESAYFVDKTSGILAVLSDEIILSPSEFSNVDMLPGQ